jgi:O-antigen ligase
MYGTRRKPQRAGQVGVFLTALFIAVAIGLFAGLGGETYAAALLMVTVIVGGIAWDYRFGVWALLALMPLSGTHLIPREMFGVTGLNPMNLVLLTTLLGYVVNHRKNFGVAGAPAMDRRLLAIYLATVICAGLNGMRFASSVPAEFIELQVADFDGPLSYLAVVVIRPLFYVLYAWLVAAAARDSRKPELLMWPLMVGVLLLCAAIFLGIALSGMSLEALSNPRARTTLSWIGLHNNDLAPMTAGAVAVCLYAQARQTLGLKLALWITAFIAGVATLLTFSRMGFLGLAVVLGGYFFGVGRLGPRLAMGIVGAALAVVFLPREFLDRALTGIHTGITANANEDALSAGRVTGIWLPAILDFAKHPVNWVVGGGLESLLWSPVAFNEESGDYFPHPHNGYLRALLDTGIIGLTLLLVFWIGTFRMCRRLSVHPGLSEPARSLCRAASWVLVVLGVQCLTGGALTPLHSQVFVWCAIGLAFGLNAKVTAVDQPRPARRRTLQPAR